MMAWDQALAQGFSWLAGLGADTWLAVASAVAAIVSFALNWSVVRRQTALQFESLKAQMDAEVLAWGAEGVDALTGAAWLADQRGGLVSSVEFRRERSMTLSRLSSLIDRGRLHFPNHVHGRRQQSPASRAFQGGRPMILNPLVFAYHALEAMSHVAQNPDVEAARYFVDCRREFVSELQHHLNPRRRAQQLRRLGAGGAAARNESYADSLRLAMALEERHPGVLAAKRDAGWAANVARARAGDMRPPAPNRPAADQAPAQT